MASESTESRNPEIPKSQNSSSLATRHSSLATFPSPQPLAPSPSSLATSHSPLFTVKTPTALVTDLGTEFGVEVGERGYTTSRVFQGKVVVVALDTRGEHCGRGVILGENESARVENNPNAEVCLLAEHDSSVKPPVFIRAIPPAVGNLGPVAWYKFDRCAEGLILRMPDSSGEKRDGALWNMTQANLVPGKIGKALAFNMADCQADQYVLVPYSWAFDLSGRSFTISLWLNRHADNAVDADLLLHKDSGEMPYGGYSIIRNRKSLKLMLRVRDAADNETRIESETPSGVDDAPQNTWVHFAAVGLFDPDESRYAVRLYLDGQPVGGREHVKMSDAWVPLFLGGVPGSGYVFRGLLDDVQIYRRALDADEIKFLFDHPGELPVAKPREETSAPAINVGTKPNENRATTSR